jgi:hypothetical protein
MTLTILLLGPLAVVQVAGTSSSGAAVPRLRIVPSPVARGTEATAIGSGFCSSPECSSVSIVLEGNTIAVGPVRSDGSFAIGFRPMVIPGQYPVVAQQSVPGATVKASSGIVVLSLNTPTTQAPPPQKVDGIVGPTTSTYERGQGPTRDQPPTTTSSRSIGSKSTGPTSTGGLSSSSPTGAASTKPSAAAASASRQGSSGHGWLLPGLAILAGVIAVVLGAIGFGRFRRAKTNP